MRFSILIFIFCLLIPISFLNVFAQDSYVCPLCTNDGKLTCPIGYEATCEGEPIEPKCIFLEKKYIAGCWKFVGVKKLDFNFNSIDFPPSLMIEVIGGGETYTLNRDTIGCKKIIDN